MDYELTENAFHWLDVLGDFEICKREGRWIALGDQGDWEMYAHDWASFGEACVEINAHLQRLNGTEQKEIDSMANYKIVGTDGYKPHPAHMENIAAGLVADATARCKDWKEIRIDKNGSVFVYDNSPNKSKNDWENAIRVSDGDDGNAFRLTNLSTELEVVLNWQTFGIIRTEETEADAPERTIADIVTLADNRLTVAHIRAIADLHETAQAFLVEAIADGRIVLQ